MINGALEDLTLITGQKPELRRAKKSMQIPGVVKVVVNMGVGEAARDSKLINGALEDLTLITGQKPELRRAKKS
ncbi:hypothetical protein BWZ31_12695, partial [Neisseria meningitidis]